MLALAPIPLRRRDADAQPSSRRQADPDRLRPLKIRTGVISNASGSALLELAQTKVLCSVHGPHATDSREYLSQGQLECSLRFASFARRTRPKARTGPGGGTAEERLLSLEMVAALSSSLQLHLVPKSTISVHALVLQDDGNALAAAISCASLALADACISSYGLVAACTSTLLGGGAGVALDASTAESSSAVGAVTVACIATVEQLTLLRHEGAASPSRVADALKLALSGCSQLHERMASSLRARVGTEQPSEDEGERHAAAAKGERKRARE